MVSQGGAFEQPRVKPLRQEPLVPREGEPRIVMVNRNQNDDEVIHQIQHDNLTAHNNLAAMFERIMTRNGVNVVLHRLSYTSPLNEYILKTNIPHRWKVPKFNKFSGDTTKSNIEHVARYLIEVGKITSNKNIRIKYFISSLTKNTFTWFTTMPVKSIYSC